VTGRPGVMLIREGQYALALLEGYASVQDLRINRRLEAQGDMIAGALPLLLMDYILLSTGIIPEGVLVGEVMEP